MGAFEDFVNLELPRRSALLTVTITGYDDDPNDGGAPAILQNSPVGTWYLRETPLTWYRKDVAGATGWSESAPAPAGAELESDVTLAVTTSGDDTPSEDRPERITGGDYSAFPFATIQAAVDSLPRSGGRYSAQINVGAGTFVGAEIVGFTYPVTLSAPALVAETPTTGPASGTATGGTDRTLVLTGASWTPNDFQGRIVEITAGTGAGQSFVVASHTADTIVSSRLISPVLDGTSQFAIKKQATTLTPTSVVLPLFSPNVGVYAARCSASLLFERFEVEDGGGFLNAAIWADDSQKVSVEFCYSVGNVIDLINSERCRLVDIRYSAGGGSFGGGVNIKQAFSVSLIADAVFSSGGGISGFYVNDALSVNVSLGCYAEGLASGFSIQEVADMFASFLLVENCTVGIQATQSHVGLNDIAVNNCTDGVVAVRNATMRFSNPLEGVGNTGWGVKLSGLANFVAVSNTLPTITGTSGEVTVDGTTDLTWAALSNSGDAAVDTATGARIYRE